MVVFKPMKIAYEAIVSNWFTNDPEGLRWVSSYSSPQKWLQLINGTTRWGWVAFKDAIPFGFVDLEKNQDNTGSIAFYIAPSYRGQRYCQVLLGKFLKISEVTPLKSLFAYVEEDNLISQTCLTNLGFRKNGRDKDDLLIFEKHSLT